MKKLFVLFFLFSVAGCSSFIYRIDVPQGNYLTDKDIENLRIGMTKEQVLYVLGSPVLEDAFEEDSWYYLYKMKSGRTGDVFTKEFTLTFDDQKLSAAVGDFELPENFDTPIE